VMSLLGRRDSLAFLLTFCVASSAWALKPETGYSVIPSDYGIVFDTVTIQTADSVSLRGWFFPAQDTAGIANSIVGRLIPVPPELRPPARPYCPVVSAPRPTVVICDGDAGNMSYAIFCAHQLFTRGFNVLTFDWRGFGESDPWPMEQDQLVYTEFLSDYDAALDYVRSRPGVDSAAIGLMGFSTGAYLSFAMAARRDDVSALLGRATVTSFEDLLPILAKLDPGRKWRAPVDYPKDLLPVNAAPHVKVPVFLIVGEKDERTPPWMSRRVSDLLKGPKEIWIVPGAAHGGQMAPEMVAYPEFFDRAHAFFTRYLSPARSSH
jgi:pimeloyl-ACP methyl ester carboxylesterase